MFSGFSGHGLRKGISGLVSGGSSSSSRSRYDGSANSALLNSAMEAVSEKLVNEEKTPRLVPSAATAAAHDSSASSKTVLSEVQEFGELHREKERVSIELIESQLKNIKENLKWNIGRYDLAYRDLNILFDALSELQEDGDEKVDIFIEQAYYLFLKCLQRQAQLGEIENFALFREDCQEIDEYFKEYKILSADEVNERKIKISDKLNGLKIYFERFYRQQVKDCVNEVTSKYVEFPIQYQNMGYSRRLIYGIFGFDAPEDKYFHFFKKCFIAVLCENEKFMDILDDSNKLEHFYSRFCSDIGLKKDSKFLLSIRDDFHKRLSQGDIVFHEIVDDIMESEKINYKNKSPNIDPINKTIQFIRGHSARIIDEALNANIEDYKKHSQHPNIRNFVSAFSERIKAEYSRSRSKIAAMQERRETPLISEALKASSYSYMSTMGFSVAAFAFLGKLTSEGLERSRSIAMAFYVSKLAKDLETLEKVLEEIGYQIASTISACLVELSPEDNRLLAQVCAERVLEYVSTDGHRRTWVKGLIYFLKDKIDKFKLTHNLSRLDATSSDEDMCRNRIFSGLRSGSSPCSNTTVARIKADGRVVHTMIKDILTATRGKLPDGKFIPVDAMKSAEHIMLER